MASLRTLPALRCRVRWAACALLTALVAACGGGGEDLASASGTAAPDAAALRAGPSVGPAAALPPGRAQLGQLIFTDPNLSVPSGTSCAACHSANAGLAGNHGSRIGVAQGSLPTSIGLRNSMTNGYSGLVPRFEFVTQDGETEAHGGLFWDGRADTLAQQALGPLLNPLEMNNPNRKAVVDKIAASPYAALFKREFGANVFDNTDAAFTQIGVAIEAFERANLQAFSSKYDAMVRRQVVLTPNESRGMALFMDPGRANCAGCHTMKPGSGKPEDSPFTDFSYYATGIPRNGAIPRNDDPAFYDLGLCGPERTAPILPASLPAGTTIDSFCGKFSMPTLRNVAQRPAFMHNGAFRDLRQVVRFYSTRNSDPQRWYGRTGVANDLPQRYLGNIESAKAPFNRKPEAGPVLNESEIDDVLAFLQTLSDGFRVP